MKFLKILEIPVHKQTRIYTEEEFKGIKIVIFKNGTVFSFGLFDKDTHEEIYTDNNGYNQSHIWIAVIRKLNELK